MTELISLRMNTKNQKFFDLKKKYSTIDLDNAKTLTSYVDSLLFKSRSLDEIMNLIIEAKENKFSASRDFKNLAILKKHIKYREVHDNFEVYVTKKNTLRLKSLNSD